MILWDIATKGFVPSLKSMEFPPSASIERFRLIIMFVSAMWQCNKVILSLFVLLYDVWIMIIN